MAEDILSREPFPVGEEEQAGAAAHERLARLLKMLHPLPARRHGEDPEVRYTEVRLVESLSPRLLIRQELPEKARLPKALPHDRHRTAIRFEEEVRVPPGLQCPLELKPEDPIGLHAQAVRLPALADLDLPAEREAQAPGLRWRPREHLLGRDEPHPLATPAGGLEGDHDLGDRKRVVEENPGDVSVLRVPPDAAPPHHTLRLEKLGATVPQGIDQGFGAAGVPVELHGRAIKVAMVEEELEAPERCLPAPTREGRKMRGTQEPVTVDGPKDVKVAGRKHHGTDRRALEARPANLRVRHWDSSVPAGR